MCIRDRQGPHIDIVKIVKSEFIENESKIERLFGYSKEGYNKIEPISINLKNTAAIISIIELTGGKEILGLAIDPQLFIKQILNPKIQSISQNEFIISVFN